MHLTLIYNTSAGNEEHSAEHLIRSLERRGYAVSAQDKDDREFPTALRAPADLVAVAGGDGTVAEVMRHLHDDETPVAILPFGTANNIARSVGIHGDPDELIRHWPRARRQRVDLFEVEGPWGVHVMIESLGAGGISKALRELESEDGHSSLTTARRKLSRLLKDADPIRLRINADGRTLTGDYASADILNIPMFGPALPILPHAELGHGVLEIAFLAADRLDEMSEWLDTPETSRCPVHTLKAREVQFLWKDFVLRLDDEFLEPPPKTSAVSVRRSREAVTVLV
jgi:diacylglycerol kinase family enzyme